MLKTEHVVMLLGYFKDLSEQLEALGARLEELVGMVGMLTSDDGMTDEDLDLILSMASEISPVAGAAGAGAAGALGKEVSRVDVEDPNQQELWRYDEVRDSVGFEDQEEDEMRAEDDSGTAKDAEELEGVIPTTPAEAQEQLETDREIDAEAARQAQAEQEAIDEELAAEAAARAHVGHREPQGLQVSEGGEVVGTVAPDLSPH